MRSVLGLCVAALMAAGVGACDVEETDEGTKKGACDDPGMSRGCGADGEGIQFCAPSGDDARWGPCLAEVECDPGDTRDCGAGDPSIRQGCRLGNGTPTWNLEDCNTPLVLAFEPGPIKMHTSAATDAFDISGIGGCVTTDWPAADNPWLAIDLDRSGAIEGGHQLFGSGTVLPDGQHATNGFIALQTLDSNGDGLISAADERFDELVLWSDYDGNRTSTLWELQPLSQRGVQSIALAHSSERRCDARGNCEGERSVFSFAAGSGLKRGEVVDMYLACQ